MNPFDKLLTLIDELDKKAMPEIDLLILIEATVPESIEHESRLIAAHKRLKDFITIYYTMLPVMAKALTYLIGEVLKAEKRLLCDDDQILISEHLRIARAEISRIASSSFEVLGKDSDRG
jgi:hypothetical protein